MQPIPLIEIIGQLIDGWREPIEYRRWEHVHAVCLMKQPCIPSAAMHPMCPKHIVSVKEHRRQDSLMRQLAAAHYHVPVVARDCEGTPTKTKSRMPGNLAGPDEILGDLRHVAVDVADEWGILPSDVRADTEGLLRLLASFEPYATPERRGEAARALQGPWRRSRVLLGYDNEWRNLDAECDSCHSQLKVERHQPRVVECTQCDRTYPWTSWLAMLPAATAKLERRLIRTEDAMIFTGRDRRVLYRWRREGRVRAHGGPREPLWDVRELPMRRFDGTVPEPPPKQFGVGG